jgi:hypothetical protein
MAAIRPIGPASGYQVGLRRAPRGVRLRDRVDVTDLGARQTPRDEGPALPIEPCDGNLGSTRRSAGVCRSIVSSGNRTGDTAKS